MLLISKLNTVIQDLEHAVKRSQREEFGQGVEERNNNKCDCETIIGKMSSQQTEEYELSLGKMEEENKYYKKEIRNLVYECEKLKD